MLTFISFAAAMLTTISFLPQAIQVIKTKDTSAISLPMYVIFVSGVMLWTMYGYFAKENAVFLANLMTLVFGSIILGYKIKYK